MTPRDFPHARRRLAGATLAALALAAAPGAWAQAYPSKSVKIVVPFPAGGTTDIVARLVAQRMSETMGQSVVVENRGGAGGSLGADAVAKAPPDGYTILMHNITFPLASISLALAGRSPYNIDTDFAPISNVVNVPLVITAHPSVAAKDLREFVAQLRANRSLQVNYGSTGPGSFMNVVGEALKRDAKIEMTHIPFKGAAPLKLELLAGRVQLGGDQISSSLAEIRKGTLKALATNATARVPALPDVPTVRELGFASIEANGWNGLFAPAKTPREVIERLQKEVAAAVRHPDLVRRFGELAAEPLGSTPAELDAVLRGQLAQFRPILTELKPSVD
ncbi:MAG: tripartite tricarboxylate transporter substrate binding protein [Burkholderiales bacterium]|nr:tripartite tricarboxylate transporter substrate binding protein [Burkholderiales bacterium]